MVDGSVEFKGTETSKGLECKRNIMNILCPGGLYPPCLSP